jgi:hypothetical protein
MSFITKPLTDSRFIETPWPGVRLYARDCGEIDPYLADNAPLFRGEEAFEPDVAGWKRWSKPSPEPRLDDEFEPVLLAAIAHQGSVINALTRELARKIIAANPQPPVLIGILRAGIPLCALLAPILEEHYGTEIPICAFSLFYGLGWDEAALDAIIADFPDRELIFVDGWTSGGGVATQLNASFADWLASGRTSFTQAKHPQFAVLCDPRSKADYSALKADFFVPSAAFTAPETLGFSRGFAFEDGSLFGVYTFPEKYQKPLWIAKWLEILQGPIGEIPPDDVAVALPAPEGFRVHVNEVTRALINRDPLEIWLRDDEAVAREALAPLLSLAARRGVPVSYGKSELVEWGAVAVAKMR